MGVITADFYAGLTYDAVWALCLALNGSIPVLAATNRTLDSFNYDDTSMVSVFMTQMYQLDFNGQSVRTGIISTHLDTRSVSY